MDPRSKSRSRHSAPEQPDEGAAGPPPGRRRAGSHDPEGNRRAVLDAARRLFGAHGYRGVGVRAIAADAGVTPGLVMAYFGTKDGLFREAVGNGAGVTEDVVAAAARGAGDVPAALADAYLERWDRLPADDPWPALIRSAIGHAPSADLLRTILDRQVGEPLARLLGTSPRAEVRAGLVRSVLFGVIMERYLFAHEPAASLPTRDLAPALAEVLAAAFGAGRSDGGAGGAGNGMPDGAGEPGGTGNGLPDGAVTGSGPAAPPGPAAAAAMPHSPATTAAPAAGAVSPAGSAGADGSNAELFARLAACAQRHQASLAEAVRPYGIGLPACDVLAALSEAGAPYRRTTGEVAASGTVRAGSLTQHADRLEAAGLVRRDRDAHDRRIVHLCLTPEGLALAERVRAARAREEEELLAPLGPAERRRLSALLGALGAG
ncbi:TetR family transcriptional regulator [Streptomyces genisteinicus]|uniref:TetR family transcriptional regulator n=1 Tax=Streptomyces genisteinicus TaxID=2768068 RepID=A0A7H0I1W4_9ACTN|nr:TetR family transcriptional regulator [Streptomyces genisteinicus]QNP66780.1 TetR family transcriptional regulator [Streptomyces genisteinicus]